MGHRTGTQSAKNGPRKIDRGLIIDRCFDCSSAGQCEFQKKNPWPATEIADGCPLPGGARRRKSDGRMKGGMLIEKT
jgi:hypothetical protein